MPHPKRTVRVSQPAKQRTCSAQARLDAVALEAIQITETTFEFRGHRWSDHPVRGEAKRFYHKREGGFN